MKIYILYLPKEINENFKLLNGCLKVEEIENSIVSFVSNSAIISQDSPLFLHENLDDESETTNRRHNIS